MTDPFAPLAGIPGQRWIEVRANAAGGEVLVRVESGGYLDLCPAHLNAAIRALQNLLKVHEAGGLAVYPTQPRPPE